MTVARSLLLFVLAAIAEIGGAWLIWQGVREHRGWVWVGAVLLACVGGMVNVIGYLGFEHQAVSHLTGTTSLLGAALAHGDWKAVAHLWGVLIAFCAGAMISGMIQPTATGARVARPRL
mgnify:CR=1 FL=1